MEIEWKFVGILMEFLMDFLRNLMDLINLMEFDDPLQQWWEDNEVHVDSMEFNGILWALWKINPYLVIQTTEAIVHL